MMNLGPDNQMHSGETVIQDRVVFGERQGAGHSSCWNGVVTAAP